MVSPRNRTQNRLRVASLVAAGILLLLVGLIILGILTDLYELGDLPRNVIHWVRRNGPVGAVAALYAEESGIPVLVPGDIFVVYMGRHARSLGGLLLAGVAMVAAVVLGATNLYWISRRWGRTLLEGRTGKVLHLTPARLGRAEHWFQRYGVWALIFGRHIPGFRIPITVAAGTLKVPYARFAGSVAVSSAMWVGLFLYAGARYGRSMEQFLLHHGRAYAVAVPVILVAIVAFLAVRHFGPGRSPAAAVK
ncbi:MAG: DedA family protein [Candidatus Dormibacteria bacterium]